MGIRLILGFTFPNVFEAAYGLCKVSGPGQMDFALDVVPVERYSNVLGVFCVHLDFVGFFHGHNYMVGMFLPYVLSAFCVNFKLVGFFQCRD